MTAAEVLRAARARVEQGWTRGGCAVDRNGDPVGATNDTAVCWCAFGAIMATDLGVAGADAVAAFGRVISGNIVAFNDDPSTTKEDVLAAFDKAIALAEETP
jgi:hypothetical protein